MFMEILPTEPHNEYHHSEMRRHGLVHEIRNYSGLAMELRVSCTNPSI